MLALVLGFWTMVITRYSSSQPPYEGDYHFEGTNFYYAATYNHMGYGLYTGGTPPAGRTLTLFDQSPVPISDGLKRGVYSKGEK